MLQCFTHSKKDNPYILVILHDAINSQDDFILATETELFIYLTALNQ